MKTTLTLFGCALAVLLLAPPAESQSFDENVANLKSPNAKTREQAASALGKSRRREAVAPLAAVVRDPDLKVRRTAVQSLRKLRDVSAVPALLTSMQDGDNRIREEALEAVVEVYADNLDRQPLPRFIEPFTAGYGRSGLSPFSNVEPTVYDGLARSLGDEEPSIREDAARAIGILHGGVVVDQLLIALSDPISRVRGAAATSLARVGSTADGTGLIPLLQDEYSDVRQRALQAIGVLRVRDATPALRALYETNRKSGFGVRILDSMSHLREPKLADLFRELLQDGDVNRRRLSIDGLARVSSESLIDPLKRDFQREQNNEVRLALAFALTKLGDRAFIDTLVLRLGSGALQRRAQNYIYELGTEYLGDLYPYLDDIDPKVRIDLADLIGAMGEPSAIEHLMPLIGDDNKDVADHANRAVEQLRGAKAGS